MNSGEGAETPEPDPVQLVDDADVHDFDDMEGDMDEFGDEIHEDLDDVVDEDLDDEAGDGHLAHGWDEEESDDDDDHHEEGDGHDDDGDDEFYANVGFPAGMNAFGLRGRFGELGNLHGEDDDEDGEQGNEEDGDDDEEEDAGVGAGIQGLLDIHRQLRNLPNDDGINDEIRRHPIMNALRGVFPADGGLGRLDVIDPRMGRIMAMLKSNDDSDISSALDQLSNVLVMSPGGIMGLATFPVESVVRSLVQLLHHSQNIEVLVKTARAMAQLVDNGFEGSLRALVNAGVVPVLRQKFENLEYIDLVEQLIRVVKPLASIEPKLVLDSGCLLPCLNLLDFFSSYIQKQILGAVDACAHAVTTSSLGAARELLAALPTPPSELVVGTLCQLVSAIAKRSPPESDLREVVPYDMWNTLVSHISSQTPHVSRVLRACSHVAARCPEYVQSRSALASLVASTLTQGAQDSFSAFLTTPKETLFSGLKFLQVLLPAPPPVGDFTGPYRKASSPSDVSLSPEDVRDYALNAIPTAIAVYGASTNTPVRQLALLVIVQTVAAKPAEFLQLVRELELAPFAAQVVAEGADSLALTVGGLDLAWDLANNSATLTELAATGISADLEDLSGDAVPSGTYSATDDLKPVAEYLARRTLEQLRTLQVAGDYSKLLDEVSVGNINTAELASAPLPELLRAGLLGALKQAGEASLRRHLSANLVTVLQGAVGRLERFQLQLTPGHPSTGLEDALTRTEKVRVSERSHPQTSWVLIVPAVSSLRVIGDFLRIKFSARRILEAGQQQRDHFAFYVEGERVPSDVSVLKAIYDQLNHNSHELPHIEFERVPEAEPQLDEMKPDPDLARHGELGEALELLTVLARENEARHEPVPWSVFQNAKLTAKLTRQMADSLIVAASLLPQWTFDTVFQSPFLYPMRTRLQFVQLTSCGLGRNLRLLRQMQDRDDDEDGAGGEPDDDERMLGRHRRQKYRLSRRKLLVGTLKLLEMSCKKPAVLDVMFYGEEGTGRGPTQEFFALASRELSRLDLGIWRETPTGLFPSPEEPNQTGLRIFEAVGRLMARALLDKRILDFRLNPAFFSVVLGSPANLETLRRVDAQLAASLELVLGGSPADVADMGLDFVLPGTEIELIPDGANVAVTAENAAKFVALIVDRVVGTGVSKQIEAFRTGFGHTIPVSALHAFMTDELVALCGAGRAEDWSENALLEAFRADHGYSMHSVPVRSLVRVLASFDSSERRKFLMFATGSPHLPIGGFKALNPPFTVVVKHPDSDNVELDRYLPSVMTCVNYLKLPQYSSEEVMRAQLKLAMTEGSEAFPLS